MASGNPQFIYPLPHGSTVIGTPYQGTHGKQFNARGGSNNWESENAVDLSAKFGTPVYAVAAGVIGNQIGPQGGGRFAGLRVHLVAAGNEFYYAHLSQLVVRAGENVHAGQLIGYTGTANGVSHLHFAAKNGDPLSMLEAGNFTTSGQQTAPAADTSTAPTAATPPTAPYGDTRQIPDYTTGQYQPPALAPPGSGSGAQQQADWWKQVASQPNAQPDTVSFSNNILAAATGGQ